MLDFETEKDLYAYTKQKGYKLVAFEGTVYDVGGYMSNHPGGVEKIEEFNGKVIDKEFYEAEHTQAARLIFRDLVKVGIMVGADPNETSIQPKGVDGYKLESKLKFDYTKAMYQQLVDANLQWDDYILYINEPKHLINPIRDVRLFENDILEILTKTPWWLIPIAWIPMSWLCIAMHNFTWESSGPLLVVGFISWTLVEYLLHRFLFHSEDSWLPNHPMVLVVHFFVHGIHHAFPQDRLRLVFPVLLGWMIGYTCVFTPMNLFLASDTSLPVMAGIIIGYICYDEMHYFLHFSSPKGGYLRYLKKYHMQHHYKNGQEGFGVSSTFWDHVFKTLIPNVTSK